MQTNLDTSLIDPRDADRVHSILRKCVHCGFCNATCPTYQIKGDELDGPRGRIYQMKMFFEGHTDNAQLRTHLDRCLTCRSCETTCPSGVQYSKLLEVGRHTVDKVYPRSGAQTFKRKAIVRMVNSGLLFHAMIRIAQALHKYLPAPIGAAVPARQEAIKRESNVGVRTVLMLSGCVQPTLTPNTNIAAINILNRMGFKVIETPAYQCCGAAALHTSESERGIKQAKAMIDQWWPQIENGADAIVVSASGCAVNVAEYPDVLRHEPEYAAKAARVKELLTDMSELIANNSARLSFSNEVQMRVAFHTPCTLQHGLKLKHKVEPILEKAGYTLCAVADEHLCCGSAGTYSMLQPQLSGQLRANKQRALGIDQPDIVATANIGCQTHIANGNATPVVHWLELVEKATTVAS
ncbi:MAG: glycolate oxidase subunit GlcF [Pseudomonadota bacterium]